MSAQAEAGQLDRTRFFMTVSGYPRAAMFRDGRPRTAAGHEIPDGERVYYLVQDGRFHYESGEVVPDEAVPEDLKGWLKEQQEKRPVPGVTHPGRVIVCPVPGCAVGGTGKPYSTTVRADYEEHMRGHAIDEELRAQLEGRAGIDRTRWGPGDYLSQQVPAGVEGDTPAPGED